MTLQLVRGACGSLHSDGAAAWAEKQALLAGEQLHVHVLARLQELGERCAQAPWV